MSEVFHVFISCVSEEFGSYRKKLDKELTNLSIKVEIQERLTNPGKPLLLALDDYISKCDAVVHLVGQSCGSHPSEAQVRMLMERHPDLKDTLSDIAPNIEADASQYTYTQWEALLAMHHFQVTKQRPRLLHYIADPKAKRRNGWMIDKDEADHQAQFLGCIRAFNSAREKDVFFKSANTIVRSVLQVMFDIRQTSHLPSVISHGVSWPELAHFSHSRIANRKEEIKFFADFVVGRMNKRFLFMKGPGKVGKSTLFRSLMHQAAQSPGLLAAEITFATAPSLDDGLSELLSKLKLPASSIDGLGIRLHFLRCLGDVKGPFLIGIDAYEKANPEAQAWMTSTLFQELVRLDHVRLILNGQTIPQPPDGSSWSWFTETLELGPIIQKDDWSEWALTNYCCSSQELEPILGVVNTVKGNPMAIATLIDSAFTKRA